MHVYREQPEDDHEKRESCLESSSENSSENNSGFGSNRSDFSSVHFGSNAHDNFRVDVAFEAESNFVIADLLDGSVELDVAVVEIEAEFVELVGDVAAGDRAKELALLAHFDEEGDLNFVEFSSFFLGFSTEHTAFVLDETFLVLELSHAFLRRGQGETLGNEIVACITRAYGDEVTDSTEIGHVARENYLHVGSHKKTSLQNNTKKQMR